MQNGWIKLPGAALRQQCKYPALLRKVAVKQFIDFVIRLNVGRHRHSHRRARHHHGNRDQQKATNRHHVGATL